VSGGWRTVLVRVFPALVQHGTLDLLLIAHGALVEAARTAAANAGWLAIQLSMVRADAEEDHVM
jgi:hypothetical protein